MRLSLGLGLGKSNFDSLLAIAYRDTNAYADLLLANGGSDIRANGEFEPLARFAKGLYREFGQRVDFLSMRSSQNMGTGSVMHTFHGHAITLAGAATWTVDGVNFNGGFATLPEHMRFAQPCTVVSVAKRADSENFCGNMLGFDASVATPDRVFIGTSHTNCSRASLSARDPLSYSWSQTDINSADFWRDKFAYFFTSFPASWDILPYPPVSINGEPFGTYADPNWQSGEGSAGTGVTLTNNRITLCLNGSGGSAAESTQAFVLAAPLPMLDWASNASIYELYKSTIGQGLALP